MATKKPTTPKKPEPIPTLIQKAMTAERTRRMQLLEAALESIMQAGERLDSLIDAFDASDNNSIRAEQISEDIERLQHELEDLAV